MIAPADGFARDAMSDDGGGLPHVRAEAPAPKKGRGSPRTLFAENERVGHWTVLRPAPSSARGDTMWLCRCDCGTERPVLTYSLRAARPALSCGCHRGPRKTPPGAADARGRVTRTGPRAATMSMRRASMRVLAFERSITTPLGIPEHERPTFRGECLNGHNAVRPCGFVSCKYHTALDVSDVTGNIKENFPGVEPWLVPSPCSLDVADQGGATLDEVGRALGIAREAVRLIETRALLKLSLLRGSERARELAVEEPEAQGYGR